MRHFSVGRLDKAVVIQEGGEQGGRGGNGKSGVKRKAVETAHRGKTCGESGNCVMKLGLLLPYIRHIPGELQLWYGVSQWYRAKRRVKSREWKI